MRFLIRFTAWLALVYFSWLILRNSLVYFSQPRAHGFVWEKGALADNPLWLIMLVIHVAAGIACLGASLLQFCRPLLKRAPAMHRWLGRIYVGSILIFLAPTGFYLAFYAHGGAAGTAGFLLLGVLTTVTTWKGWREMRRRRTRQHARWMVRSFAMATGAITFRIEHLALQLLGVNPDTGFMIALYVSILGNALVAELLLHRFLPARKTTTRSSSHESPTPVPAGARVS